MRGRGAAAALAVSGILASGWAARADALTVRIEGKILRKGVGRLVFSLSEFELEGRTSVEMVRRGTGERRTVRLSSVYPDLSYSEELSPAEYEGIEPEEWVPHVEWEIPDAPEALRARLSSIYAYQNRLRREIGAAVLSEGEPSARFTSRVTLNKIEKFHRVASAIAKEYRKISAGEDGIPPLEDLRIRVDFNPLTIPSEPRVREAAVREVVYWEVYRILSQQFGIGEELVEFLFESPQVERVFAPVAAPGPGDAEEFFPGATVSGDAIAAALYLQRQGFLPEAGKRVRLGWFKDPFITDRPQLDRLVNEGTVVGISGGRVALSFVPPFERPGDRFLLLGSGEGKELVVQTVPSGRGAGYAWTAEIPETDRSRVRPGMAARRE